MSSVMPDTVVANYLERLRVLADQHLSPDQASELLAEIGAHITEATSRNPGGQAELRQILDRLGEPEDIVAAAAWNADTDDAPPPERAVGTRTELTAVLLLTVGSIVPLIGWLAGVIVAWNSRLWTTREKLLATLIVPGGPFGLLLVAGVFPIAAVSRSCTSRSAQGQAAHTICTSSGGSALPPWVLIGAAVLWAVTPIVVALVLLGRARRRAAGELPTVGVSLR